jgi:hypothetical protein
LKSGGTHTSYSHGHLLPPVQLEESRGGSRPARSIGEGLRPAREARGRPARWCGRASRGQPEPRSALDSAGRGCRRPAAAAGNTGGGVLYREQGGEGERGREGSEKLGRPLWRALRYGRRLAHASMEWGKLSHGCHARGHAPPIEAFYRARGGRQCGRCGS